MRAWALGLLLLTAACNQGNGLSITPADMAPTPDLAGRSCGEIVRCALTCGTQDPTCLVGCGQGASTESVTQAGALVVCAAQNCLSGDGGTAGMLQIFTCLSRQCSTQLRGCEGLELGGL